MDSAYNSSSSLNLRSQDEEAGRGNEKWIELDEVFAALDRLNPKNKIKIPSSCFRTVDEGFQELQNTQLFGAKNPKEATDKSDLSYVVAWLGLHEPPSDDFVGESNGGVTSYIRQSSWPVPERTPAQPLPCAAPAAVLSPSTSSNESSEELSPILYSIVAPSTEEEEATRLYHLKILFSLPRHLLSKLWEPCEALRRRGRGRQGCTFCRSNGEQYTFYMSHELKGKGGVTMCPVLRAYVCIRCGSTGDQAHTIRYCPYSSMQDRLKSLGLNQGLRLASGRLRQPPALEPTPRFVHHDLPLKPAWAALEQKLNMSY